MNNPDAQEVGMIPPSQMAPLEESWLSLPTNSKCSFFANASEPLHYKAVARVGKQTL